MGGTGLMRLGKREGKGWRKEARGRRATCGAGYKVRERAARVVLLAIDTSYNLNYTNTNNTICKIEYEREREREKKKKRYLRGNEIKDAISQLETIRIIMSLKRNER